MNHTHITELIVMAGILAGWLVVVLGSALADRIRYGRLDPHAPAPTERAARVTRRRAERRAAAAMAESAEPAPSAARAAEADDVIAALITAGHRPQVAAAAARHARATLGEGAALEALVREALRACPGSLARTTSLGSESRSRSVEDDAPSGAGPDGKNRRAA